MTACWTTGWKISNPRRRRSSPSSPKPTSRSSPHRPRRRTRRHSPSHSPRHRPGPRAGIPRLSTRPPRLSTTNASSTLATSRAWRDTCRAPPAARRAWCTRRRRHRPTDPARRLTSTAIGTSGHSGHLANSTETATLSSTGTTARDPRTRRSCATWWRNLKPTRRGCRMNSTVSDARCTRRSGRRRTRRASVT